MKETPPTVEVSTSARVFARNTEGRLRNASGINGAFDRDSITRNDPSTTADRPSGTIVYHELKPEVAALVSPKTKRIVPSVTVMAPGMSSRRFFSQPSVFGRNLWLARAVTMPIGTLTNITERHPKPTVSAPPAMAPAANPAERTATRTPSALFLWGPSGNIRMKIAKAVTVDMAAPIPCNALKTIRTRRDGARPPAIEATVKRTIPATNILFWP